MVRYSSFVTIGLVYVTHTFIILSLKYEGRSCWTPHPGQHNRANLVSRGVGEPALKLWTWGNPITHPSYSRAAWAEEWPSPTPYQCLRQVWELFSTPINSGEQAPAPWQTGTVEPALLVPVWLSQPWRCEHERVVPISHLSWRHGQENEALFPLLPTFSSPRNALDRWERWPCDHKSGRAIPNPYQPQQSGEQTLHPARAAQQIQPC